jgi:hypothetical protein
MNRLGTKDTKEGTVIHVATDGRLAAASCWPIPSRRRRRSSHRFRRQSSHRHADGRRRNCGPAVATRLGIAQFARVAPADKRAFVRKLKAEGAPSPWPAAASTTPRLAGPASASP